MAAIKIENADVQSPYPLVIDVMSADEAATEPTATHVLKFGDFVILGSLDNLKVVTPAEKAKRDAEALAKTQEAELKAQADNKAAQEQGQAQSLSAAATDAPAKYKRAQLEDMTKDELQGVADDLDIDITSHSTKAEMVDAILKGQ
jgi:Rho termination factor, N-terminal domain